MGLELSATAIEAASPAPSRVDGARAPRAVHFVSPLVIVALVTVAAGAVRFATLGVQSIWFDEAVTVSLMHHGLGSVLATIPHTESNPPLYYVLAWAWTRVFGTTIVGLRALSALAGTLTVPVAYLAGRSSGRRAGLWAMALAAVSPELFYYSQEARNYALLILLSAAAFVCWQRALQDHGRRPLVGWTALSVLALATHYFAAFLFLGEAAVLIRRRGWRPLAAPLAAVLATCFALLPLVLAQQGKHVGWLAASSVAGRVLQTGKDFLVGQYGPWGIVVASAAAIAAAVALLLIFLSRPAPPQRRRVAELVAVALTALLLPAALSATGIVHVFDSRNVLGVWVPCAVLVAIGLAWSQHRWPAVAAGTVLCAVGTAVIAGVETMPVYQRDDWRGAARAIAATLPVGGLVVTNQYGALPLRLYLPQLQISQDSGTVQASSITFVFLRAAHPGRWVIGEDSLGAPLSPAAPRLTPPGFWLAHADRTAAYATYRFRSSRPLDVSVTELRVAMRDPRAELAVELRRAAER